MTEFFSHPVPAVVILLGLLVFVHEFGHFIVGRLSGIAVEIFSIGFGPRIFSFRRNGTEYRLSWIPLGGYVKFAGAHPSEEIPEGLPGKGFLQTSLPRRAATVLAGPLANFILAVVVYTILGGHGISHPPASIGEVIAGSAADQAGIRYGDTMVKIGDRKITMWRDLEEVISKSPGKELTITMSRPEGLRDVKLTPAPVSATDMLGKPITVGRAGIALGRQPPVISVLTDGLGSQAGLKTGDRIESINVAGETKVIKAIPELKQVLADAMARQDVDSVTLSVLNTAPADIKGVSPTTTSAPRSITLPLTSRDANVATVLGSLGLADAQMTIGSVTKESANMLQKGDILVSWNGVVLRDFYALGEILTANTSAEGQVSVSRDFKIIDLTVPLDPIEIQRPDGPVTFYTLPFTFWTAPEVPESIIEKYNGFDALVYGVTETGRQTAELGATVARLFTGDIPIKALGGPMMIAKVAGDSARQGWLRFMESLALVSINLGLLNLFPIPVLDGGQLVLMLAEAVKRRPLREAAIENFQKVGFAMIVALVMLATYNDLSRFWKSMLASLVGLFQ